MVQHKHEPSEDQSSHLSDILANLKIDESSSLYADTAILHEINTTIEKHSKAGWHLYVLAHRVAHEKENYWEEHGDRCPNFVRIQLEKFDEERALLEKEQKFLHDQLIMLQKNHPKHFDEINNDRIPPTFFISASEHQTEVSGEPWA
ncbi:hypothetical protein BGZ76_006573, partial [Entomortierella beljakovae]